jgi:hypothetical protein
MSDIATRQAIDGSDDGIWAAYEQAHNHLAIGENSRKLSVVAGDLTLSKGYLGYYNGSQYYVIANSASRIISVAGLTVSLWARIELSVVAGSVVTEITSIVGANDPLTLPASFTSAYDATKGGVYISSTKRCIGLVFINAAGSVAIIVNLKGNICHFSYPPIADTYKGDGWYRKMVTVHNNADPADTNWHEDDLSASLPLGAIEIRTWGSFTSTSTHNISFSDTNGGDNIFNPLVPTANGYASFQMDILLSNRSIWYKAQNAAVSAFFLYLTAYKVRLIQEL